MVHSNEDEMCSTLHYVYAGDPGNELVDALARRAAEGQALQSPDSRDLALKITSSGFGLYLGKEATLRFLFPASPTMDFFDNQLYIVIMAVKQTLSRPCLSASVTFVLQCPLVEEYQSWS